MWAYWTEVIIHKSGELLVRGVPFREGERVEVIVLRRMPPKVAQHPLRQTPFQYHRPFDSVAEDDWVLR